MTVRLTPEQLAERIAAVRSCDLDAALARLDERLRTFEVTHGMTTEEMYAQVADTGVHEGEIDDWLWTRNMRGIVAMMREGKPAREWRAT